jgi:2',3'-cyclic-nucleotide 2'-phosphodiesterase (5'-nucleotidase family)
VTPRRRSLLLRAGALAMVAVVALPACGRKYQAERDGKDVGEAVCDVRDADTPDEAKSAATDLNDEIKDLQDNYAVLTAEDRKDIDENVTDLLEHVRQGNEALVQQDLTVIHRSLENIRHDLGDAGKAAIDGIFEGVDDCLDG